MKSLVSINNINKYFGENQVLHNVSLSVQHGQVVCIVGPSGAGKSTLLRCINALSEPDSGYVSVNDEVIGFKKKGNLLHELSEKEICRQRQNIGMVFQQFNLFPHLTVLQNVTIGPTTVLKNQSDVAFREARELLDRVGLLEKSESYPKQLSGGQQQRVAIARALAMKPDLLLFDEPTSALDPELVGEVLAVIQNLAQTGITMVIVTHEIPFALKVADRVVLMKGGKVVFDEPPDEWRSTDNPDVRNFLKHVDSDS